jgi:hypothetical protein
MRYMTAASLTRLAGPQPTGLRILFASMARVANAEFDRFARISFLEGLLGYRPGSLYRNRGAVDEALDAVVSGVGGNKIADSLLHEKGMSERDAAMLLGRRDTKLREALLAGIRSAMPSEDIRGLTADGIAQDLSVGTSPLTGEPFPAWKGGNIFWHTGLTAQDKTKVSLAGLASILKRRGYQKTIDIVDGTRKEELGSLYLDAPVGDAELGATLQDAVSGDSAITRADYVAMYEAVFKSPAIMRIVDKAVKQELGGPAQERVWEAVKRNPHLIILDEDGKIGIEKGKLAKEIERMFDVSLSGTAVRNAWLKVWPAMIRAFKDSEVARNLLRNREIMEIIEEETRRRRQDSPKVRGIRFHDDPGYGRPMPGMKWAAKRVAARYMKKQAGYYGIKARWRSTEEGWGATYQGHQLEVWRSPYGGDLIIYIDGKKRGTKPGRGQGAVDFAKAEAEEIVDQGMV